MQVFTANLVERIDRKHHILSEYDQLKEFTMTVVPSIKDRNGAIGLWKTLLYILNERVDNEQEYFIFCEDDHTFTRTYSAIFIKACIDEARKLNADILLGGISWFDMAVQVSDNLFWMNNFSGTQFVVFFKKFYQKIRDVDDFQENDSIDHKIGSLTDKKFFIYPFISIQKEFGYSDATKLNNVYGRVDRLFSNTSRKIEALRKVKTYYKSIKAYE